MLYYDVTSMVGWGGRAVGIIRVEREMLKALLADKTKPDLTPVIYHTALKLYFTIRPDILALFLAEAATLDFSVEVPDDFAGRIASHFNGPSSRWGSSELLAELAVAIQARIDALEPDFQESWIARPVFDSDGSAKYWIPFLSAASGVAMPGEGDVVYSGGLDWDNKDVRAIGILKERLGFTYVQFIYDLVPVLLPQFVVPGMREKLSAFFHDVVWLADRYVCSSEHVIGDLRAFVSEATGREPRTTLVKFGTELPPASSSLSAVAARRIFGHAETGQYALYVSTIEPRKNHRTLYLAWKRAVESGALDPDRHRLVFVGMPGWSSGDIIREIDADRSLRKSIVILNGMSDADLSGLYAGATVVVFPSFNEGYGLAVAEALAFGKFVISSNAASLPEVGGDLALYLDPDDIVGWSEALALYLTDEKALETREQPVAGYAARSWKMAADDLASSGALQ